MGKTEFDWNDCIEHQTILIKSVNYDLKLFVIWTLFYPIFSLPLSMKMNRQFNVIECKTHNIQKRQNAFFRQQKNRIKRAAIYYVRALYFVHGGVIVRLFWGLIIVSCWMWTGHLINHWSFECYREYRIKVSKGKNIYWISNVKCHWMSKPLIFALILVITRTRSNIETRLCDRTQCRETVS